MCIVMLNCSLGHKHVQAFQRNGPGIADHSIRPIACILINNEGTMNLKVGFMLPNYFWSSIRGQTLSLHDLLIQFAQRSVCSETITLCSSRTDAQETANPSQLQSPVLYRVQSRARVFCHRTLYMLLQHVPVSHRSCCMEKNAASDWSR